jgi:hypothetical protein
MIVLQVEPVDEKIHWYKCRGCSEIAFIREEFWGKRNLKAKKYICNR